MPCHKCGQGRGSTANTAPTGVTAAPRIATASPIRYIVKGKKFSTLTAAQDYARSVPGAVIRHR